MADKHIPIDAAKQLGTDGLLILLIKTMNDQSHAMEGMGQKVDAFIQIIDGKVGREEFRDHEKEEDAMKKEVFRRIELLEDLNKTETDGKRAIKTLGKNLWKIITGAIILLQFIALAFQAGQEAQGL